MTAELEARRGSAATGANGRSGLRPWQWLVAGLVVVLYVFGFLAYTGQFRDASVARVVRVRPNGDLCVRSVEGSDEVDCINNGTQVDVEPGDCVSIYYGEGVSLEGRADCPD